MFPKEFNRVSIPPKHIQHDPKTLLALGDGCDMREQSVANFLPPKLWSHKEIL